MNGRLGKGIYAGGKGGGYARVEIGCQPNQSPSSVQVCFDRDPRNDHLREGAYKDWEEAAIYGCRFALNIASIDTGEWEIRRIIGQLCDTSATFVAVAAARATWNLSGFQVPSALDEQLNHFARHSKADATPDFSRVSP